MPEVSVIVPLYNKAMYVERCVASVRAQTFADFEVIVVDDGSTDSSVEDMCRAFAGDRRFRLVSQANGGVSKARNTGIEHAAAELIAFLDADDEWRPGYLEAIVAAARRHPQAVLIGTGFEVLYAGRDLYRRHGAFGARTLVPAAQVLEAWGRLRSCPLFIGATAMRRAALRAIGGFEPGMHLGEELLVFLRLLQMGDLSFDDRPLATYHQSAAGSLSTSPSLAAIRGHRKLVDEMARQARLGRCPEAIYRRWLGIHVGYLMDAGQRAELIRVLCRAPRDLELRQWLAGLLEILGMRGVLRRLLGRA
jgi:glycosyltransferase involved in cell wall biosynthesis